MPATWFSPSAESSLVVPLASVYESSDPAVGNYRVDYGDLAGLAESIGRDGLLVPLVVVDEGGRYRLVDGHRRYRACGMAGLAEVPVSVQRGLTAADSRRRQWVANGQARPTSAVEDARAFARMAEVDSLSVAEVAAAVGKAPAFVAGRLSLLRLPVALQEVVGLAGGLSVSAAEELARLVDPDLIQAAYRRLLAHYTEEAEPSLAVVRQVVGALLRQAEQRGLDLGGDFDGELVSQALAEVPASAYREPPLPGRHEPPACAGSPAEVLAEAEAFWLDGAARWSSLRRPANVAACEAMARAARLALDALSALPVDPPVDAEAVTAARAAADAEVAEARAARLAAAEARAQAVAARDALAERMAAVKLAEARFIVAEATVRGWYTLPDRDAEATAAGIARADCAEAVIAGGAAWWTAYTEALATGRVAGASLDHALAARAASAMQEVA